MTELEEVSNRIDAWCRDRKWEWRAEITGATLCAWSCKLTIDLSPDTPGRSLSTMAAGGQDAAELLDRAWADMHAWLLAGPGDPPQRMPLDGV